MTVPSWRTYFEVDTPTLAVCAPRSVQ
jgi:hypothetical protein